jgi:hypothetical protein
MNYFVTGIGMNNIKHRSRASVSWNPIWHPLVEF